MNKNWRQKVLEHFQAPFYHITLVTDPDSLLQDEAIISELHKLGIDVVEFQDRAVFRYWYESQYRPNPFNSYLLIHPKSDDISDIPYDIWAQGKHISICKSELFPMLSAPIVQELDFRTLDALSLMDDIPVKRSDNDTINFLLKRIYKLPFDTIDTAAEFILLCISRHQLPFTMPETIEKYLIDALNHKNSNPQLVISELIQSSDALYSFLQQEWCDFLESGTPKNHPQWDTKLQDTLAGLFRMGKLRPIPFNKDSLPDSLLFGVKQLNEEQSQIVLISEHISQIEKMLELDIDRRGWVNLIGLFSTVKSIMFTLDSSSEISKKINSIEQLIEERFALWLNNHYGALASLSDQHTPVMLHKVAEHMHLQGSPKKAIIVMDGLSFVQWSQVRSELQSSFDFIENGTFAWIPTLTSVSRQAIFSGEIPKTYYSTIHTTANEEKEWRACWAKYGIAPIYVTYEKSLGQGEYNKSEIKALSKSSVKVAGLVVDIIDKLTHNTIQGHRGMHGQISIWLKTGYLQSLLHDLLEAGFDVYITSDHGNKESVGIGAIREGVLADTRGERVRIYNSEELRDRAAQKYSSQKWESIGLPDEFFVLAAKSGEAFVKEGEVVVSHGGTSIEEVIVPFVRVKKRRE
ncbi:BREX-3 system phosphatase PglZ [Paenibacillus nasutitermitis]|uniref:Alkaline phosphatase n=1 Tax=Paenibacillus nasutitermitis TaxID=1652958 RepID=A0A916ZIS3_9BACL|nr:BREX-3 system phosphatase PglZ [Paenibacillus nasutitermitis]GGD99917.1 alkaline phosphatase [Paenibacillus nasutitermitis]